ncbi:hypothetical protein [Streptomyces sp. SAS_272]|uniref:hypothetical protein n=1 Tax=Streptomyces sp. SAS_272 TaxID=3412747 RepID=UPI00403CC447
MPTRHASADRQAGEWASRSRSADGLPGLIHAVWEADGERLCSAVLACTKAPPP